jgi:hypothetical protein
MSQTAAGPPPHPLSCRNRVPACPYILFNPGYGPLPPGTRHRPESRLALEERQRGISIPRIDCPLLVVASSSYPTSRGSDVVNHYGGELLEFPTLDHGSVIEAPEVARAITAWL